MSKYYSNKSDFSEAGSNLQSISGGDTSNSNNSYNYNNYISGGYPSGGSSKSMSQLINDIEEVANTVTSEGVADLYVQTGEAALNVTKNSDEFDKATTRVSKILKSAQKIHQNIMQNIDSKFTLGIDKVLEGLNKINGSESKYKTKKLKKTTTTHKKKYSGPYSPPTYQDITDVNPYNLSEILDGKASPIKAAKDVYSKRLDAVKDYLKHKDEMTDQQIKEIKDKSAEEILELRYPKEIPDYQKLKASRYHEEHRETLQKVDTGIKILAWAGAIGGVVLSPFTGGSSLALTYASTAYLTIDSGYSAVTGHTMITGDRLSTEERVWAGIDAASVVLSAGAGSYLTKLRKAGKAGSTLLKLASHADDVNDASKVVYAFATDKDPKAAIGNLVMGQVQGAAVNKAGGFLHGKFGKANAPDVPDIPTNSTKQHIEVDSSGLNSKKLKIDSTVVHQKKTPKLDLKIEPTVKADLASTPKPHVDVETSKIKPVEAVAGAATAVPKSKKPDIDVLTKPKDLSTIKGEAVDHVGTAKPKVDLDLPKMKQIRADYNDYVAHKTSLGEKPLSMSDWKLKVNNLKQNQTVGKEFKVAQTENFKQIASHVENRITIATTVDGQIKKVQVDAIGFDSNGKIRIQDYTASSNISSKRQAILDNIERNGGVIFGKGKGKFVGGVEIPKGTRIDVINSSNQKVENFKMELEKLQRPDMSRKIVDGLISTENGQRLDPSRYLSHQEIETHLNMFKDGVVKVINKEGFHKSMMEFGGNIGPEKGHYVMPKFIYDKAVLASDGNPRVLEELLGLDRGYLGDSPLTINVKNPKNLRMPSGNEPGAWQGLWEPGGFTKGGIPEAVVDQFKPGDYTVGKVFE